MRVWLIIILVVVIVLIGLSLYRSQDSRQVRGMRIVSLSPAITEILFELGLGEQIVGTSEFSDHPPQAREIPRVAKYGDPNIELILRAKPDLVVGQKVSAKENERLQNIAAPSCRVLLLKTDTLSEIIATTEQLADAAGVPARGKELANRWRENVTQLKNRYGFPGQANRPRVYVEVGSNPLRTCGAGTYLSEMIELVGGRNLGDEAGGLWPVISSETVVVWNPQVILVMGMPRSSNYKNEIASRLGWAGIEAVKNGRIIELADDLERQGPRLFQAGERLGQMIHGTEQSEKQQ